MDYREKDWPLGTSAPYQVELVDGASVYVGADSSEFVVPDTKAARESKGTERALLISKHKRVEERILATMRSDDGLTALREQRRKRREATKDPEPAQVRQGSISSMCGLGYAMSMVGDRLQAAAMGGNASVVRSIVVPSCTGGVRLPPVPSVARHRPPLRHRVGRRRLRPPRAPVRPRARPAVHSRRRGGGGGGGGGCGGGGGRGRDGVSGRGQCC